ncbi:MAG: RHS repeat-associated core domain-containing protein [Litorimonas sp.]
MSFAYDSGGNLTSSPGQSYAYDYADRLTSVTNGTGTHTLTYDALSRLSTVGGTTNDRYSYDGQDMIERRNTSGSTLEARYIHGPGSDEPIARYTYSSPTSYTRTFYSVDVRGSITGHTQGAVSTAINSYDVYGRPDGSNIGLYQYTGQIWLEELELYYYKARSYDPKIRRFLNADPIGYADGMNMYGYVSGDPVNMIDPTGANGIVAMYNYVCYSRHTGFTKGLKEVGVIVRRLGCVRTGDNAGSAEGIISPDTNAGWKLM